MIKFSFEVPISYLNQFDKVNDYHFILAHLLFDNTYADFYHKSNKYKILDNGCAELGKSIDTHTLIKLAREYKVNTLILPDVWMNANDTFGLSKMALDTIITEYPEEYERMNFMFVPQGKTLTEFTNCLTNFIDWVEHPDQISMKKIIIGLPYLTCAKIMNLHSPYDRDDDVTNARIYLMQKLHILRYCDIHLLGAGFNYSQEISFMRHYYNVISADTSTPYVLALNKNELGTLGLFNRKLDKAGTLNFNVNYNKEICNLAIKNAQRLKSFGKI